MLNSNKSLLLLTDGATLPTTSDFFELQEPIIINPSPTVEEFTRVSGKLGNKDSYADTAHVIFSESVSHKMRHSDSTGSALETTPDYGELLKISGMKETIDTGTPSQETVIYTNTQSPTRGSATIYIDGKKFTLTDTIVADTTFSFEVGKAGIVSSTLSGFIDSQGIPVTEANPSVSENSAPCVTVTILTLLPNFAIPFLIFSIAPNAFSLLTLSPCE
jgi:hypothetical protein